MVCVHVGSLGKLIYLFIPIEVLANLIPAALSIMMALARFSFFVTAEGGAKGGENSFLKRASLIPPTNPEKFTINLYITLP